MTLRRYNHHFFADGDRPVFLVGGGGYGANTDRVANNHADLDDYLGHYRSLGLNYTRSFCIDPWSSRHFADALFPWARVPAGSGRAGAGVGGSAGGADGLPRFDLDRWDDAWWGRLRYFLTRARDLGIYVQLCVFDHCGLQGGLDGYSGLPERWRRHPFNPDNHVNGLDLPRSDGRGRPAFYDLGNRRLIGYQERFFARLLAETAPLGNVNYQICNEYAGPWSWTAHWAAFCRRWEAEHRHAVLVGCADHRPENEGERLDHTGVDFVDIHGARYRSKGSSADYHDALARLWSRSRTLTMDECSWWLVRDGAVEPDATVRRAAREFWGMALGGAAAAQHKEREECAGPACPRGYGDPINGHRFDDRLETRLGHLCRFMNGGGAPIWGDMAPMDGVIRGLPPGVGGYCLAAPAGALVYLWRADQAAGAPRAGTAPAHRATDGTLELLLPEATTWHGDPAWSARWFDPERGDWQPASLATVAPPGVVLLRPPTFDSHLALRIEAGSEAKGDRNA
jgi:hypothetical protein